MNRNAVLEDRLRNGGGGGGGGLSSTKATASDTALVPGRLPRAGGEDRYDSGTSTELTLLRAQVAGLNADLQRETEAHRDNVSRLVRQYALSNVNANVIAELAETHAAQERRLRMQVLCPIPRPMKCDS